MTWFEWAEALSYVVTIFGLPLAILVFIYEQRRERRNEDEETYQRLSDEYTAFLKLVLENPDLQLLRRQSSPGPLSDEQIERKLVLFNILISLFERAYILVYEEDMDKQTRRLWQSWEDYMREWCRRPTSGMPCPACCKARTKISAGTSTAHIANEEAAAGQTRI